MRKLILGFVIVAGLTTPAVAAKVRFDGLAEIYATSGTCTDWNPLGARYVVRYRPPNLGDNGPGTKMSFFAQSGAMNFTLASGRFSSTAKTVQYTEVYDGADAGDFPVKVAFKSQSPSTPTSTTNFITATGTIANFDQMSGCTASFRLALTLHVQ